MKTSRVLVVTLVIALLVGGGILLYQQARPAQATAATTAPSVTVTRGEIESTISATGHVATHRQSGLTLKASGQVQKVLVQDGQEVQTGDVLVQLDATDLSNAVSRAQASLTTAQARLEQAKSPATAGQVAAAKASVASAKANLNKLLAGPTDLELQAARLSIASAKNQLWSAQGQRDATKGSPMSSGGAKDGAEAQVLVAEVAVQQAEVSLAKMQAPARAQDIAAATAQVELAEAQLAQLYERPAARDVAVSTASLQEAELALQLAKQALQDAQLVAPFSGTVLDVAVSQGERAAMGVAAVQLADTQALVLDVLLDEVDVAQVHKGQVVRITFDALPAQVVQGTVERVAPSATKTSSGQAYSVRIHFGRGELPVRLGMSAQVDIVTRHLAEALLVPNRAVESDRVAGRYFVTRTTLLGNEKVEIKIGLRNDEYTEVLEGLNAGDTVLAQTISADTTEAAPSLFPPMPSGGGMPQ